MVIAPVDQRYFDIGSLERPRCRHTGETAADDQDAFFAWDRLRYSGLFLRERFGQNCSHGSTPRFRGALSGMRYGGRLILKGGGAHRTYMPLFTLVPAIRGSNSMCGRFCPSRANGREQGEAKCFPFEIGQL